MGVVVPTTSHGVPVTFRFTAHRSRASKPRASQLWTSSAALSGTASCETCTTMSCFRKRHK